MSNSRKCLSVSSYCRQKCKYFIFAVDILMTYEFSSLKKNLAFIFSNILIDWLVDGLVGQIYTIHFTTKCAWGKLLLLRGRLMAELSCL